MRKTSHRQTWYPRPKTAEDSTKLQQIHSPASRAVDGMFNPNFTAERQESNTTTHFPALVCLNSATDTPPSSEQPILNFKFKNHFRIHSSVAQNTLKKQTQPRHPQLSTNRPSICCFLLFSFFYFYSYSHTPTHTPTHLHSRLYSCLNYKYTHAHNQIF